MNFVQEQLNNKTNTGETQKLRQTWQLSLKKTKM